MKITRISAALAALVLTLGLAGTAFADTFATVDGHLAFSSEANSPDFWGDNCEDAGVDSGQTYVLPDIDGVYDQVIVKSGSGEFANTIFDNPAEGETVWADTNGNSQFDEAGPDGDQGISHIIVCTGEAQEESEEASVEESTEASVEGSVLGGTGTPAPSTPDTALDGANGPSPLPTIVFGAILLASLAGLAWVNVQAVRTRS